MRVAKSLSQTGESRPQIAGSPASARPAYPPAFAAMTVERDDVALAQRLLADRTGWDDAAVVESYEERFAAWNGSRHAFAFMGARVALSACIDALGLRPGDEVLLPGYTCIVVANALRYAGLTPVYVDIELDSYGMDIADLRRKVTARSRAIILQHLYGLVSLHYEAVVGFARERQIPVIEDCAHATGATLHTAHVGNLGDLSVYSSERSKVFSTVLGGIATTNDPELAGRLRRYQDRAAFPDNAYTARVLRNVLLDHCIYKDRGRRWRGRFVRLIYGRDTLHSTSRQEEQGNRPTDYGMRMPAPIARLGLNQLGKIEGFNRLRRRNAQIWDSWCDDHGFKHPVIVADSEPVFLRYPVLVPPEKKTDRRWVLDETGVEAGVWFVSNLHPAPVNVADCPRADEAVRRCINLPCLME